ncbi:fumarylacetoacetate hydrolase family protein, partial [Streptomyces sp. NRRL F-5122]
MDLAPDPPTFFTKPRTTRTPPHHGYPTPRRSQKTDYEVELAVVIG